MLSRLREALIDQRRIPIVFVLGAFLSGIAVNDATAWVASRWPKLTPGWLALGVLGFLLLVLQSDWFFRLWRGAGPRSLVVRAGHCRGLVVFASMGGGIATAEAAIRWHAAGLERVWILHSDLSRAAAEKLANGFRDEEGFRSISFETVYLTNEDFDNPEEVRAVLDERVYGALGAAMEDREVVIDFTGGTKTTTAGAFLAGLPEGRRMQVNRPAEKDDQGRGMLPGPPFEILIDYRLKRMRRK